MLYKMLKKNCHQVLGSQKSELAPLKLVFQTAGAIGGKKREDRHIKEFVPL